jgi:hypothetical protein
MSDPFNILGQEFDTPPTFDEALRDAMAQFQAAAERFNALTEQVSEEDLTDQEWRVVEGAAEELMVAIERADEGYVAVQYDSHAWYRIMDTLTQIRMRLDSASGILELARARKG